MQFFRVLSHSYIMSSSERINAVSQEILEIPNDRFCGSISFTYRQ